MTSRNLEDPFSDVAELGTDLIVRGTNVRSAAFDDNGI